MKRLAALLAALARQAQRSVSLEEALFTSRGFAYVWYRARFLLLRIPFGLLLHGAEVVAFSAAYDLGLIGPMLAIRSLPAVGAALFWGALEALRQRVRSAGAKGEWGRAERAVRSFLGLAVDVGLGALAIAFVYVEFVPSVFGGFDIFDAYAIACSLRFAAETLARTYHAGIFALRRVYRPWWSLLLPDSCEVALALALWPTLGPWGFSISTLVAGLFGALLQAHYARLAYHEHGRFKPTLKRLHAPRADIERRDYVELARHALANLASHVDALLVVLLSRSLESGLPFVVLLHAGRPLLSAVSGYARVFYFDFQRLELGSSRFFSERFARIVGRFALALAGAAIALAGAVYAVLSPKLEARLLTDFALLGVYIVARSTLALEQLRLFSAGRYRPLAHGALALIGVAVALRLFVEDEQRLVSALVAALSALAAWLHYQNRAHRAAPPESQTSLLRFLQALREGTARVEVGYALVDRHSGASVNAVQRVLAEALSREAGATVFARSGKRALVWYTLASANAPESVRDAATTGASRGPTHERRQRLLAAAAGCVEALELSGPHAPASALSAALKLPGLVALAGESTRPSVSLNELRSRFADAFAVSATIELDRAPARSFLPNRAVRAFVAQSVFAACAGRPAPSRRPEFPRVAVYCPAGEPHLVFLATAAADATAFRDFRALVDEQSLADTLAPPVTYRQRRSGAPL